MWPSFISVNRRVRHLPLKVHKCYGMIIGLFVWQYLNYRPPLGCGLTGQGRWEMRRDIKLANVTNIFFQYEQFQVASAKDLYKLASIKGYQGTIADPMQYHNGMNFTTEDDFAQSSNILHYVKLHS